jgi:hypothetical protein
VEEPKSDTGDIFNEFYKDSAVSPQMEKKNTKTFSMKVPESPATEFAENGRWVVQIATMGSRVLADELATEFKEKGYPAYMAEVQNPTPELQGTYYRVRIGAFASRSAAAAFGENVLKPANYDYWVDRKSNDGVGVESNFGENSYSPPPPVYTPPAPAEPYAPVQTYKPPEPSSKDILPTPPAPPAPAPPPSQGSGSGGPPVDPTGGW